jgi:hypothetical protein
MPAFTYRLERTNDSKYLLRRRRGLKDAFIGDSFVITGPSEPALPEHPLTRQEFYTLLSDLAAKGYWDSLLQ